MERLLVPYRISPRNPSPPKVYRKKVAELQGGNPLAQVRVVNFHDRGYLNSVMNSTVTKYQVGRSSRGGPGRRWRCTWTAVHSDQAQAVPGINCIMSNNLGRLIHSPYLTILNTCLLWCQECLDTLGPFWSASDLAREGVAEDMQVFRRRQVS